MDRYGWRRLGNTIVITSSIGATVLGLGWLVLILGSLIYQGLNGLSLAVFTQMTPPPGADGGLLNPIIGSLMLTTLAIAIGTPIGILAGIVGLAAREWPADYLQCAGRSGAAAGHYRFRARRGVLRPVVQRAADDQHYV